LAWCSSCRVCPVADDGLVPLVISTLRKAGWRATRIQAGTAHGGSMKLAEAGWPDVVGLRPRTMGTVLIECKTERGKLRPAQADFAAWCETNGHRYVVVRNADDVARLVGR